MLLLSNSEASLFVCHVVTTKKKKVSTLLMTNAPAIQRPTPRACSFALAEVLEYLSVLRGATYRKNIISTPNILAMSHLLDDTLLKYFSSSL